jgi:hypothetical protein
MDEHTGEYIPVELNNRFVYIQVYKNTKPTDMLFRAVSFGKTTMWDKLKNITFAYMDSPEYHATIHPFKHLVHLARSPETFLVHHLLQGTVPTKELFAVVETDEFAKSVFKDVYKKYLYSLKNCNILKLCPKYIPHLLFHALVLCWNWNIYIYTYTPHHFYLAYTYFRNEFQTQLPYDRSQTRHVFIMLNLSYPERQGDAFEGMKFLNQDEAHDCTHDKVFRQV